MNDKKSGISEKLTLAITFDEWVSLKSFTAEEFECPECNGEGETFEDVMSSKGNWHEIVEPCEKCNESGSVSISELKHHEIGLSVFISYRDEVLNDLVKYSRYSNCSLFELLCANKHIFVMNKNTRLMKVI